MSLIYVKNEQNPAVSMQSQYPFKTLQGLKKGRNRMPTAANVRRQCANNAHTMSQIGAGFTHYNPVDFDQFNRLDFDTVVTSGQPSLF